MKEKTILKVALIVALVGIIALIGLSLTTEFEEINLAQIEGEGVGNDIKLMGRISNVQELDKLTTFTISQQEYLSVIRFKNNNQDLDIKEGDTVEIIGEVSEYQDKEQVIANRIRVLQ